jgi:hypothetical protein
LVESATVFGEACDLNDENVWQFLEMQFEFFERLLAAGAEHSE